MTTWTSDDWDLAKERFAEKLEEGVEPIWLHPDGWWTVDAGNWVWDRGYDYMPPAPLTEGLREVTRYDYWEDLPEASKEEPGSSVRALFEGKEYVLQHDHDWEWHVFAVPELDWIMATVRRDMANAYYAGLVGWENTTPGNMYDTLYRLVHGEDAE
jgi:hypothetical protein